MKNNRKWVGLLVAAGVFGTSAVMAQQGQGAGYPGTGQGAGAQGGSGMQSGGTGAIPQGDAGQDPAARSQGERATPTGRQPGKTGSSGMQQRSSGAQGSQGATGMQRGGAQSQGERATPTGRPPGGPSASMYETGPFKQGDRLPTAYRDRQYVIDNYQAYDLPRPPRGQRWVGVGSEYLLVGRDNRIVRVEAGR